MLVYFLEYKPTDAETSLLIACLNEFDEAGSAMVGLPMSSIITGTAQTPYANVNTPEKAVKPYRRRLFTFCKIGITFKSRRRKLGLGILG
jgi:hypothetical protein